MLPRDPREVPAMKPSDRSLAQVRKNNILKLVSTRGSATVSELCEHFGVSPATIRNDLRELEASQLIERTHGGAMRSGKAAFEPDNDVKSVHRVHEKAAIARAALRYIKPRDIISLDTGTTTYQLAMLLGSIEQLTVVTCDLQIAAWLESNTDVNLILVGGQVRHGFHCTGGQTAIELLSRLHVDKASSPPTPWMRTGLPPPRWRWPTSRRRWCALPTASYCWRMLRSSAAPLS